MRAFEFGRAALTVSVVATLLAACGGGSAVPIAADDAFNGTTGFKHHQKFSYTGYEQTFTVPKGVKRLAVVLRGALGGGYGYSPTSSDDPGLPGKVYAVIPAHSGAKLYVFVGGFPGFLHHDGGFNGGGYSEDSGGGGASDIRVGGDKLKNRIIVAAGGGGAGACKNYCFTPGGSGGGLDGRAGRGYGNALSGGGGGGGTQSAGGSGGAGGRGTQSIGNGVPGTNGTLGIGGNGGDGGLRTSSDWSGSPGGGGGGGYYGGGGGGGSASAGYSSYRESQGGGGGGGSSYVEPNAITSHMWSGWRATGKTGDGQIIVSW